MELTCNDNFSETLRHSFFMWLCSLFSEWLAGLKHEHHKFYDSIIYFIMLHNHKVFAELLSKSDPPEALLTENQAEPHFFITVLHA